MNFIVRLTPLCKWLWKHFSDKRSNIDEEVKNAEYKDSAEEAIEQEEDTNIIYPMLQEATKVTETLSQFYHYRKTSTITLNAVSIPTASQREFILCKGEFNRKLKTTSNIKCKYHIFYFFLHIFLICNFLSLVK